jgi:GntR family transcriptional regulator, transcriptional repressor for pyruvate dehydrogenase complex
MVQNGMNDPNRTRFQTVDPKRRGTTSEEVAGQLSSMIYRGELRPGDRLPPERDLAKMLGVSRPTVRGNVCSRSARIPVA